MQTRRPEIAVLLAAWNGVDWLPEQLETITAQKDVQVTIFVSVDKSSDGTEELVANLSAVSPKIILLPVGQKFGGAAPNFFRLLKDVDFSNFDYISLADQDDWWGCEKLTRAVQVISDAGVDCYSSNVTAFWSDGRTFLVNKAQKQCQWDYLFEAAGPGCTYVFNRIFAEKLQNKLREISDDRICSVGLHDWFIYAFARASGFRWVIDQKSSMRYRQHESNQVGVNNGVQAFIVRAKKVLDGWWVSQSRLISRLVGVDKENFCLPWQKPGRRGMFFLAMNCYRIRRKLSDKIILGIACFLLAIVGDSSDE